MRSLPKLAPAATLVSLLAACAAQAPEPPPAAPPPVAIAVAPAAVAVVTGDHVTFTAAVENAADPGVSWTVTGASCGTVTPDGVYTAPPSPAACAVVATSRADPTKTATALVTVNAPVAVAVTPSPAATNGCQSLTFSATVTGTGDGAVAWSIQEGAGGGTIRSDGVYTAPATAGTYHVVATSHADPTKVAVAAVTVTERVLAISVSPATATVVAGGTVQFTATITTTCGTFTASKAVAAPAG